MACSNVCVGAEAEREAVDLDLLDSSKKSSLKGVKKTSAAAAAEVVEDQAATASSDGQRRRTSSAVSRKSQVTFVEDAIENLQLTAG